VRGTAAGRGAGRAASLAAVLAVTALSGGCSRRTDLAQPPQGFRLTLTDFLQHATNDPPPPGVPVVLVVYSLPEAGAPSAPLDVHGLAGGRLPPWASQVKGPEALATRGLYVGVLSLPSGSIRYLVKVADPRAVRSETLSPTSEAELFRASGGVYSAKVPFIPGTVTVSFETDGAGDVGFVHYYLPFSGSGPGRRPWRFDAQHD
jgi:hypothetical protein